MIHSPGCTRNIGQNMKEIKRETILSNTNTVLNNCKLSLLKINHKFIITFPTTSSLEIKRPYFITWGNTTLWLEEMYFTIYLLHFTSAKVSKTQSTFALWTTTKEEPNKFWRSPKWKKKRAEGSPKQGIFGLLSQEKIVIKGEG